MITAQAAVVDSVQCSWSQVSAFQLTHWGRDHMAAIFQTTFSNAFSWMKNAWILFTTISLNFVPKGPINNIPALVQIMAWRRPGDKPLSDPRMLRLPTHICVTRPQWVKNGLNLGNMVVCVSRHGLCITTKCGISIGISIKKKLQYASLCWIAFEW